MQTQYKGASSQIGIVTQVILSCTCAIGQGKVARLFSELCTILSGSLCKARSHNSIAVPSTL